MPDRTVGLPIHLLYPLISCILLALAAFPSADAIWYVSASTQTQVIRFGPQNYCGYAVDNLVVVGKQGCIYRGYEWQIPPNYFGFRLPDDISYNLSKVAVTSVVAFFLVLVSGILHAYTIRYSFRKSAAPNKDKLYSLGQVHFISVTVCFLFTFIAFIAQAAVIGNATSYSGDIVNGEPNNVAIEWGQSPWLVLAAGFVHIGWGYEAVRWRAKLS